MSILIKGIGLPKDFWYLDLVITSDGVVRCYGDEDAQIAEAIELPDHGALVDRDGLIEEAKMLGTVTCNQPFDFPYGCNLVEWCKAAETVIPAERSE